MLAWFITEQHARMSLRPTRLLTCSEASARRTLAEVLAAGQREQDATAGMAMWAHGKIDKLRKDRAFLGRQNALTDPSESKASVAVKKFTSAQVDELATYFKNVEAQAWQDMSANTANGRQPVKKAMTRRLELKLRLLNAHLGLARMAHFRLGGLQRPFRPGGLREQKLKGQRLKDWAHSSAEEWDVNEIRKYTEDVQRELSQLNFS